MAEIPVQRKKSGGLPWWLIPLLALLILLPLLFLLARGCTDNTGGVVGNAANNSNYNRGSAHSGVTNSTGGAATTNNNFNANAGATSSANNDSSAAGAQNSGAAITDARFFAGVNDKASLVGRQANLKNARVSRVLSDHVFTVKAGSGEMFVYLDESQDTGGGQEKSVKIRAGQRLNLNGEFRRVPNSETESEKTEEADGALTGEEYAQMSGQQVYLHATRQ